LDFPFGSDGAVETSTGIEVGERRDGGGGAREDKKAEVTGIC